MAYEAIRVAYRRSESEPIFVHIIVIFSLIEFQHLHLHPDIDLTYDLVQQFAHMLRTRTGEQLDAWLEHVRASQIRAFQSFVVSIERDKAAVVAGLTLTQNNGLVEGKVNKLKLIKRMMYGRAKFPLLRQRVLHAL